MVIFDLLSMVICRQLESGFRGADIICHGILLRSVENLGNSGFSGVYLSTPSTAFSGASGLLLAVDCCGAIGAVFCVIRSPDESRVADRTMFDALRIQNRLLQKRIFHKNGPAEISTQ